MPFQDLSWLLSNNYQIVSTLLSTVLIYGAIIVLTRLNGLRTFAKMSSFDFAITIAIGSLIASTIILEKQSVVQGVLALSALLLLQAGVAWLRKRSTFFENLIGNTPVLLMDGEEILYENLKATNVAESDLYAKLREANVTDKEQVFAVILETTGDISVLHSNKEDDSFDEELLKYVQKKR